jgi:hypothetical protein
LIPSLFRLLFPSFLSQTKYPIESYHTRRCTTAYDVRLQ